MPSITVKNISDFKEAAVKLLENNPGRKLFAIKGVMGAGKTTFIKAICKELGVKDNTGSPTFSIINEYLGQNGSKIYHFDFYRIKNIEEVYDIGYEDYFFSAAWCFIEWPEKIAGLVPADTVEVEISVNGTERVISY